MTAPRPEFEVVGPLTGRGEQVDAILRALPDWFGIESAIVDYVNAVKTMPTFEARADGQTVGFVSLKHFGQHATEVYVMGVLGEHHRKGVGRALMDRAFGWAAKEGFEFIQVKTVSGDSKDPNYALTRKFYLSMGFVPLEVFPTLWDAHNPCLQLIRVLDKPL